MNSGLREYGLPRVNVQMSSSGMRMLPLEISMPKNALETASSRASRMIGKCAVVDAIVDMVRLLARFSPAFDAEELSLLLPKGIAGNELTHPAEGLLGKNGMHVCQWIPLCLSWRDRCGGEERRGRMATNGSFGNMVVEKGYNYSEKRLEIAGLAAMKSVWAKRSQKREGKVRCRICRLDVGILVCCVAMLGLRVV